MVMTSMMISEQGASIGDYAVDAHHAPASNAAGQRWSLRLPSLPADDHAALMTAAEALTNPPDLKALSTLLGTPRARPPRAPDGTPDRCPHQDRDRHCRLHPREAACRIAPPRQRQRRSQHAGSHAPAGSAACGLTSPGRPNATRPMSSLRSPPTPHSPASSPSTHSRRKSWCAAPLPWDSPDAGPREWEDADDIRTAEWLQLRGINVAPVVVGRAAGAVAREQPHPSRARLA